MEIKNKKDLKIKKLHERGLAPVQIAKKLGYSGGAVSAGIERVNDGLQRMGLK